MKALKRTALILLIVLVVAGIYCFAVYKGYSDIPRIATKIIARRKGLNERETESLHKVINLNKVLHHSDNAKEYEEVKSMILDKTPKSKLIEFTAENYSGISESTFEKIRVQLQIAPDDFATGREIIEDGLTAYREKGLFMISNEQRKTLKQIQGKYGLTDELFRKLH